LLAPLLGTLALVPHTALAQDVDACINANEKAQAFRKKQQFVEARAALSTCAASTCPEQVSTYCRQRLSEVMKNIPSVVIVAKDGAGRDLTDVKVTIDGNPYADHLDGRAIELDPGKHTFRFEVAGQDPVVQDFLLEQGEQNRRETVVIGPVAPAPSVAGASGSGSRTTPNTLALVVGGVGVAGLVASGIFAALSVSAHNAYEQDCGGNIGAPPNQCTSAGVSGEKDAAMKGTLATGLLIGGAALAATGAIWYLVAPGSRSDVRVGVGPFALSLSGRF
jgi:hypothetical protein